MKMTFRWYDKNTDPIPLEYVKQIPNCSGIMGMIDDIPAGEIWPLERIKEYVDYVNSFGLECEVIESVNVHEDIKLGLETRDKYIENYIKTIENLAKCGIKVIIYNFMPVFDWLRTDLYHENEEDHSTSLYHNQKELEGLTPRDLVKNTLKDSKFILPGWEPERLSKLDEVLKLYEKVDDEKLLENYKYFLEKILPTCEKLGVKMAVHPDDPAWPVFGIPRIAHKKEHFDRIISLVDSPSNCLCICTGSLGSNPDNDIPNIIRHFGKMGKIACMHVRNVKYLGDKEFREAAHLSKDGNLDMFEIMKAIYETAKDIYIRPDHGRMIWGEEGRAGYGLYDRALGLCYLNGLWEAIEKFN
ncbi:MAG: mannonate dehydratase [Tissierellia bacterium]|nr:mannonate dehydratase [Tissierellia bacterium]